MRFNIAIPTHLRDELLVRTLESLSNAVIPDNFQHVFVIENGTRCEAENICRKYSKSLPLIYKYQETAGKARALQLVINELKDGFVLFLDDDVRVSKTLLIEYNKAISRHGSAYIYGGPILIDYQAEPEAWLKKYLPPSVTGWSRNDVTIPYIEHGYFLGANYGVFAEDIINAGGFLYEIGPGSQVEGTYGNPVGVEVDIQNRLLQSGKKRYYIKDAMVWHYVPRERCTPDWMLHRTYRREMTARFLLERNSSETRWLLNKVPMKLWLQLPVYIFLSIFAGFIPDARIRFQLKREYYKLKGQISGYQLARK